MSELPTLGMSFKLNKEFNVFNWYGNGPQENYIDRKEGAKLGVYSKLAKDNLTPYLVPQECGNYTNTRWVEVRNNKDEGLRFSYEKIHLNLAYCLIMLWNLKMQCIRKNYHL